MTTPLIARQLSWSQLIRDIAYRTKNNELSKQSHQQIRNMLSPVVALAYWLVKQRPDLIKKKELNVLLLQDKPGQGNEDHHWNDYFPALVGQTITVQRQFATSEIAAKTTEAPDIAVLLNGNLEHTHKLWLPHRVTGKLLQRGIPVWSASSNQTYYARSALMAEAYGYAKRYPAITNPWVIHDTHRDCTVYHTLWALQEKSHDETPWNANVELMTQLINTVPRDPKAVKRQGCFVRYLVHGRSRGMCGLGGNQWIDIQNGFIYYGDKNGLVNTGRQLPRQALSDWPGSDADIVSRVRWVLRLMTKSFSEITSSIGQGTISEYLREASHGG